VRSSNFWSVCHLNGGYWQSRLKIGEMTMQYFLQNLLVDTTPKKVARICSTYMILNQASRVLFYFLPRQCLNLPCHNLKSIPNTKDWITISCRLNGFHLLSRLTSHEAKTQEVIKRVSLFDYRTSWNVLLIKCNLKNDWSQV